MNTGVAMGISGAGQGLMEGIGRGLDIVNTRENIQNSQQTRQMRQDAWNREKAEFAEKSELVAMAGLGKSLGSLKDNQEVDVTGIPMPQMLTVATKGAAVARIRALPDGYEFFGDDGSPLVKLSKEQAEFYTGRAATMLEAFHGMKMNDEAGGLKRIEMPVRIRGREAMTIQGREDDKGNRAYDARDVELANDRQRSALRSYMALLEQYGSNPSKAQIAKLDDAWAETGDLPDNAYHRGGRGMTKRGTGIRPEQMYGGTRQVAAEPVQAAQPSKTLADSLKEEMTPSDEPSGNEPALAVGDVYADPQGNKHRWNGTTWTPVN